MKKLIIILTIIIYGCDEIKFPQYMLSSKKKSTEEIAEEFKAFGDGQSLSKEKQSFDSLFLKLDNSGKWGQNDRLGTINYISNQKIKSPFLELSPLTPTGGFLFDNVTYVIF